jgi:hypothetical protein
VFVDFNFIIDDFVKNIIPHFQISLFNQILQCSFCFVLSIWEVLGLNFGSETESCGCTILPLSSSRQIHEIGHKTVPYNSFIISLSFKAIFY